MLAWGIIGEKFEEEVPKALLGLAVPIGQYAWAKYQARNVESRKKALRQEIATLTAQREAMEKVAMLPQGETVLRELNEELDAKLIELSSAGSIAQRRVERKAGEVSPVAKWLLAYTPVGRGQWALHILFYLCLSLAIFTVIGLSAGREGDDDWPLDLTSVLVWIAPAAVFAVWANRLRDRMRGKSVPSLRPGQRVSAVLFWIAVVLLPLMWIGMLTDDDYDGIGEAFNANWPMAVGWTVALVGWAIVARRSWRRAGRREEL